ncbi:MAG: saccharopine dehydrogenase NADP-binding domain-containing protein [Chloroflexi bacterium]|nr:saccharopine dehydrogenase NADP-binding domain-containing protein [Chloroflexota bacterium]
MTQWMLYGATGFTGTLLAEEAARRGLRPVLAGRSKAKLEALAKRLGLDFVVFGLDDVFTATGAVKGFDLVLHAAGPFMHTSAPMLRACLNNRAHYLDITGEISVFQHIFLHDAEARAAGIALIPGVGFDIVPSDGLALYVAQRVPGAKWLETALDALAPGSFTAGTAKSMLEIVRTVGIVVRRGGQLVPIDFGAGARQMRFASGERLAVPIPWGDVETSYHATKIPNITAFMALALPRVALPLLPVTGFALRALTHSALFRQGAGSLIERVVRGPSAEALAHGRSYLYARAWDDAGDSAEAWLETREAYAFTVLAALQAVAKTLELRPVGALTPSMAFGADFVLEIDGSRRYDTLPG